MTYTVFNTQTKEVIHTFQTGRAAERFSERSEDYGYDDTCPHGTAFCLCEKLTCKPLYLR